LRLDGFVSVEPIRQEGSVTTKPFVLAGRRLELNLDARDGAICVEVLDPAGEPIPGYGRDEAATIQDLDGMRLEPRWEGHPDLNALVGRTVRVRFYLENAKLYAFQIRPYAGQGVSSPRIRPCRAG
jgi:hypothetical protein